MITSDCRFCGIKFKTYSNNICCSKECKKQWTIRKNTKMCNECNEPFISADNRKKYCSKKLKNKNRGKISHVKRAIKYGVKYEQGITIDKLKKRDGNKCLECGCKVKDDNIGGFHKKNATIGHLIAMSKGGSHTWGNIQLECMECNTSLGVKTHGQTRMVL